MQLYRICFLILLPLGLFQCTSDSNSRIYGSYSDNLESLTEKEGNLTGRDEKFRVGNKVQLMSDTAKSGKTSLRLDTKHPYGLNYKIPNVRTDENVEISVWYSGPGKLVLVASHKDAKYFYRKSGSVEPAMDKWKELELSVSIPPTMNKEDLNIYVWNPGQATVYVDDFKVSYKKYKSYPSFSSEESLHLLIDTLDMIRLEQKRNQAFANGILETEEDDYVSGILYYKDSLMPVEIRLKGDWLDHLEGRKWSFRVKVKKQNTWKNLRAFSLQTPFSRDFLNEYVAHQLYEEYDLLTTRYGFVPITLNGTSLGIYAWEEHFDKQLIESSNRREGPILKFEESLFWQSQKVFIQDTQYFRLPFLEAADVIPFKPTRTFADPTLREGFLMGHNLMFQNRSGIRPASEIFDLHGLAGYYALMDLTRGFHGVAWHNQRYYYNPVLCRLEPIFFDAYTEGGVVEHTGDAIAGMFTVDPNANNLFETLFWIKSFQDTVFVKEYIRKLEEVSDPVWINNFLQEKYEVIKRYEEWIQQEFVDYKYDRGFLLDNARKIRLQLPEYKKLISDKPDYANFNAETIHIRPYSEDYDPRFPEYYLNAYLQDSASDQYNIRLDNFYPLEIELIGYGASNRMMDGALETHHIIGPFDRNIPVSTKINIPLGNKYVFFKVKGYDDRFSTIIMDYPAAKDFTPEQELFDNVDLIEKAFIKYEEDKIIFGKGAHQINEPIIIPAGYNVIFSPGCEMDFIESSFLISKSPVFMEGSPDEPVKILSGDNSSNGFTVLQAEGISSLNHVIFEGLNTLNYKGWMLTGAVNFYESDVEINNVEFKANVCEDALNIIRSDFSVSNSKFSDIYADAFDSDFCTGLVESVKFENIGNDAIDFSGSQVEIRLCQIIDAGDKGVSCGENSTLLVTETTVTGANIGFASKDKSHLELKDCSANNTIYGLLAFQKKPEYGPGNIKATGFNASDVKTLFLIERFSKLSLNGTIVTGKKTNVAAMFY